MSKTFASTTRRVPAVKRNGQAGAASAGGGGYYVADVSGWGGGSVAWADIADKPDTLAGYGITDALGDSTTFWGQTAQGGEVKGTLDGVNNINMTGDIEGAHNITLSSVLALGGITMANNQGMLGIDSGIEAAGRVDASDGLRCGSYVQGSAGAAIDAGGNAEVESITSRSWLKVRELIYNRLNALEGDTSFADSGVIESLDWVSATKCIATMRMRWDGDFTAFQPGDIVYGYVNDLGNSQGAGHYKAWARVASVDRAANALALVHYDEDDVPAGVNHAVAEGMTIARWGNAIEPNAQSHANPDYSSFIVKRGDNDYVNTRQQSFFISCDSGAMIELMGVRKPVLEAGNYGAVLGQLPAGLLPQAVEELINKHQPYLYARGIVVQDLLRVNYQGVPVRDANHRGAWSAAVAVLDGGYRCDATTYDTVTHSGSLWQCLATGTTDEPADGAAGWALLVSRGQDGQDGAKGDKGADGKDGAKGDKGDPGQDGAKGDKGDPGQDGAKGDKGDPGQDGAKGDKGDPGDPGQDGAPGAAGRDGLMAYPAGEYDRKTLYEATGDTTPVVLYEGNYYSLVPGATYRGSSEMVRNTPAKDVANATEANPARWRLFDKFYSIFADIVMAEFAKLGSAIFFGDWMISQRGTLRATQRPMLSYIGGGSSKHYAIRKADATSAVPHYCWMASPTTFPTGDVWTQNTIPKKTIIVGQIGGETTDPTPYLWAFMWIGGGASGSASYTAMCLNPGAEGILTTKTEWQFCCTAAETDPVAESDWTSEFAPTADKPWVHCRALVGGTKTVARYESDKYEEFKTGGFDPNVAVNFRTGEGSFRGDIRADGLTLGAHIPDEQAINGTDWILIKQALVVASQYGRYALPMIAPGHSRVIEILFVRYNSSETGGLSLRGATSDVYLIEGGQCTADKWAQGGSGDGSKEYSASEPGLYRAIGYGIPGGWDGDDVTVWNIVRADDGGEARSKIRIKEGKGGPSGGVFGTVVGDSTRDPGNT